jgi:polyisoprenoid-binding protein YceI
MNSLPKVISRREIVCRFAGFAIVAGLIAGGCAKNPADDVTAASVSAATNTTPATSAPAAAGGAVYKITDDSTIKFVGSKVTGKHDGGFKKFTGQFQIADGKLAPGDNKITIDTASLYTDTDRLTGHLKTPDFFDVAKYPEAVFQPTAIEPADAGKVKVTGNLTLHGITKQISFPADFAVKDDLATLKAEFFIKRFDFEIKYPGKADDLVRDEVVIRLDVKAKKVA